jgi:hypothetical protein
VNEIASRSEVISSALGGATYRVLAPKHAAAFGEGRGIAFP